MNPVRQKLREATAAHHQRVDDAFAAFDLASPAQYGRFLRAHARVLPAMERAVDPAALWSGWRPRAPLLLDDLARLGVDQADPMPIPAPDLPERWGLLYVMEGSRLGGAMLSRRVPPALPSRYLSAGHVDGSWQAFQSALEGAGEGRGNQWLDAAIEGTRRGFDLFGRAAASETEELRDR